MDLLPAEIITIIYTFLGDNKFILALTNKRYYLICMKLPWYRSLIVCSIEIIKCANMFNSNPSQAARLKVKQLQDKLALIDS